MLGILPVIAVLFVVAFLLGSVPWGLVISKLVYHKDLRSEGSGNIGTTNAMRSLGKVGGAAVFLLDFGKGLLSGVIGAVVCGWLVAQAQTGLCVSVFGFDLAWTLSQIPGWCMAAVMCGCVLGHVFSPWLRFHGGKGIAVALGCMFVVYGVLGACIEIVLFAALVLSTRYVSVGSIAATVCFPFLALCFYWGNWIVVVVMTLLALVVIWAHRENIARLRAGNENRIGSKKKGA